MPRKAAPKFHKLRDSALFKVTTRKRLAEILLCTPTELKSVANSDERYKNRWKPKNDDKAPWLTSPPAPEDVENYRPIDIPVPPLKKFQGRIASILSRIEPPDFLFSPVKGRSYVENAAYHKDARAFWQLDIANYFPSCTDNRVAWFFRTVMQCAPDVTAILVKLTCYNGSLPQGSPSSPILAYFSNSKMWAEIDTAVRNGGCKPSVYADDIAISGQVVHGEIIWNVKKIVHKNGFKLKSEKEHSLICAPAEITGTIISNGRLKLPNRQWQKLNELVKEKKHSKDREEIDKMNVKIAGRLAQLKQIESAN